MKIFPIVKKVITVVQQATGLNFPSFVKPAVKVQQRGTLLVPERPALSLDQRGTLLVAEDPAVRMLATVQGDVARPPVDIAGKVRSVGTLLTPEDPGLRLAAVGTLKSPMDPAANIVQVEFDLSHTSHVVTAANDLGNVQDWTTPANMQGAPNSAFTTFASGLLLRSGKVRGTAMVAQPNRPVTLLIKEVWLRFHYRTQGFIGAADLLSNLALGYRINTAPLPTADFNAVSTTANENFLVAGREVLITNGAGTAFTDALGTPVTWANIALLQPFLSATTIANPALGIQYDCDAVRLRVVAEEIWTP